MKAADLKTKTPDELNDLLLQSKRELFNLRFQVAAGELKNTSRFRIVRRTIARVHTLLTQQRAAGSAK